MRRRTFVLRLGGATALGFASPSLGLETVRHSLTRSMAEDRAEAHADDWAQIAADHARGYLVTPPTAFLGALAADLVQIQRAADAWGRGSHLADLRRSAAVLACLTALTAGNLGRQQEAVRWWRTARRLADDARDPLTVAWVRGEEVVRSGYERRPHPVTLALADEAEARAGRTPASGTLSVLAGRAQTLAAAGRDGEADAALARLRDAFASAPPSVTGDRESLFGWPERALRFTESVVHSHLGRFGAAGQAQDRALELCPPGHPRGRTQIELHRALCLVRGGDVAGGTNHALAVLARLPDGNLVLPLADLGRQILASVPVRDRHQPGVGDLRAALGEAGGRAAAGA
jgi:tetratricopeptide (TPR) repeat protein